MRSGLQPVAVLILACLAFAACDEDDAILPDVIALPNAFRPEGIDARGNFIYVGSIPNGSVYRADIVTGEGSLLVPTREGRAAIGLKIDSRDRLFVAGGSTGKAFVYDAATGQDRAIYTLTLAPETFVNDVVLTPDAAWFTDSRNPVLYRVPRPADGSVADPGTVSALGLSGDLQFVPGVNNLNGIAFDGQRLVVVQSNTGFLFTVDPGSGVTRRIDLGEETVANGDGLLLQGRTLYGVQNRRNQVAVIDLSADSAAGTVRTRIMNPLFDVPTTLAAAGPELYAVNARFGVEVTPATTYTVVRFSRP